MTLFVVACRNVKLYWHDLCMVIKFPDMFWLFYMQYKCKLIYMISLKTSIQRIRPEKYKKYEYEDNWNSLSHSHPFGEMKKEISELHWSEKYLGTFKDV